jgi:hypothetical protein
MRLLLQLRLLKVRPRVVLGYLVGELRLPRRHLLFLLVLAG